MKNDKIYDYVSQIIDRVRKDGDQALIYYTDKFDNCKLLPKKIKVSKSDMKNCAQNLDPLLKIAIEKAAENIRNFHKNEMKKLSLSWMARNHSKVLGQIHTIIEKVGIYVPGGKFSYPSTVLMSSIPAKVAGVKKLVMATPPNKMTAAVLYAAKVSGVDEIYSVGGPAAIAALAYGTKTISPVDFIIGPGNIYVNEAKRQVFGKVGIDSLAGPSEVAIIADRGADVSYVVSDLLAQSEHDLYAKSFLFSDSQKLLSEVKSLIPKALLRQIKLSNVPLIKAIEEVNRLAPEHLELMVKNPEKLLDKIKNAGAIFAGYKTPTALGDYWAGPSHVLPTGGAAKFMSGLSVQTFIKRTSYINYQDTNLRESGIYIEKLAESEGLKNHGESVCLRRGGK